MSPASAQDRPATPPRRRWTLPPPPDPATVRALSETLRLPPALCHLLAVRGYDRPAAAKSFLRPLLDGLHDPGVLVDARKAAGRLAEAVARDEMVVVHGDYDADGICASALLAAWIRALGGRAEAIVPDRRRHGYDLSEAGVARAAALRAGVLVTVDCGIVAHGPVRQARDAGMTVIVTDHHRPDSHLPDAFAVVNPNRPDCAYPNKHLCGAGVAFKIGQLTAALLGRPAEESWSQLDLVALATIADQVDLQGENRTMTRYGLRVLGDTSRRGLRALMAEARIVPGRPVDSARVAYDLAPRINAAGRVGDPGAALDLLLTGDEREAHRLAGELGADNRQRKKLEKQVTEEAIEAVRADCDPASDRAVVVAGEGWHPGVIGIVASRLVDRLFRPVIVVSLDGDSGRGSARSIPSFDLHAAIASCSTHLTRFGGHHQAAGLDIRRDRLPGFREAFLRAARRAMGADEPVPVLHGDMEIGLAQIDRDFNRYLRYLGPFGRANPEPVLVARGVRLESARAVKGGHLKFRISHNGTGLNGIGFGMAESMAAGSLAARPVDVAFNLIENTYQGHTTFEAKALDMRPAEAGRVRSIRQNVK